MEMLKANYVAYMTERGRKNSERFSLTAQAGDSIFIHTTNSRCECHFETLSGLRRPHEGTVNLQGTDLYALSEKELAAFRRERIGAIPFGGGLIPEIRIIDQIVLPLKLAGVSGEDVIGQIQKRTSELLPLHSLYNIASKVTGRKNAHAAILRATINEPRVLILDRALDGFNEIDADVLWKALNELRDESTILLYFSSDPAPTQITWTQSLHI